MRRTKLTLMVLTASIGLAPLAGCENLPGNKKEQGAVIGGVGGAVAGAALGKGNRGIGALIGGALGAGGGYLVGAKMDDKDKDKTKDGAIKASQNAQQHPATAADVKDSSTADLNADGFVTLDEVVAMKDAGLGDKEMIKRLQRTQQYFELTDEQMKYLRDHQVDEKVITAMRDMRPDEARTASATITTAPSDNSKIDMRTNPR
jgi:Glycine zipper